MERMASSDATLELTIISVDNVTCANAVIRRGRRPSSVAWIDQTHKITSTKTFPQTLHLPLSPQTLHNPNSCLVIQIFFPKLPFPGGGGGGSKLFGSAQVPLSSFTISGSSISLPLISSSGKHRGSIVVRVRVLWCLDSIASPESGAWYSERRYCDGASTELSICNEPTAPPEPRDQDYCADELRSLGMADNVEPAAEEIVNTCVEQAKTWEKDGALRSFLVGLFGGVIATVLVGISGATVYPITDSLPFNLISSLPPILMLGSWIMLRVIICQGSFLTLRRKIILITVIQGQQMMQSKCRPSLFGTARSRAEVLADKGLDWRKIDTDIDTKKSSRSTMVVTVRDIEEDWCNIFGPSPLRG